MTDAGYVILGWGGTAVVLAGYVAYLFRRSRRLEALVVKVEERPR